MALNKGLKTQKGADTTYHMIKSIYFDNGIKEAAMTVASYANATYRELEKEYIAKNYYSIELLEQYEVATAQGNAEEAHRIHLELTDLHNWLRDSQSEYEVEVKEYPIENITDMSLPTLYGMLKQRPEFDGAMDIFEEDNKGGHYERENL